jgi:hypothetical protein
MSGFEQGHYMVGKVATNFTICVWFLLESAKDQFLGVDLQDNMCHHVFDMERLAY